MGKFRHLSSYDRIQFICICAGYGFGGAPIGIAGLGVGGGCGVGGKDCIFHFFGSIICAFSCIMCFFNLQLDWDGVSAQQLGLST